MGSLFQVDGVTGNLITIGSITSTSTTSGFLPPRLTTIQRDAIPTPSTGVEVFNTDTNQLEFYNGSIWTAVGGSSPAGSSGAVQFNSSGSFGGDASKLFWDDTNFRLGIGTNTPGYPLDVNGDINCQGSYRGSIAFLGSELVSPKVYGASGLVLGVGADSVTAFQFQNSLGVPFAYLDSTNKSMSIGPSSPDTSAILDLQSTTQGFLPPRMTTTQKTAIASPALGSIVYDTTLDKLSLWTGSVWETITSV